MSIYLPHSRDDLELTGEDVYLIKSVNTHTKKERKKQLSLRHSWVDTVEI